MTDPDALHHSGLEGVHLPVSSVASYRSSPELGKTLQALRLTLPICVAVARGGHCGQNSVLGFWLLYAVGCVDIR